MTFLISGRVAFVSEQEMKGNRRAYIGEITRKDCGRAKYREQESIRKCQSNTEQEIELAVQEKTAIVKCPDLEKICRSDRYFNCIRLQVQRIGPVKEQLGTQRFTVDATEILLYYGEPSPFSTNQEIYLDFLPRGSYINSGVWKMVLTPKKIVDGHYEMWIPGEGTLNPGTGFLRPVSSTTLTNPATAIRAITVGAYDSLTFSYADFSGRGPLTEKVQVQSNQILWRRE